MIGKLICSGATRAQAVARICRALAETLFEGVTTSSDYALQILGSDRFRRGDFHTGSLENGDFDERKENEAC